MTDHECIEHFETRKIDDCSGQAFDKCSGVNPMILSLHFEDKDGTECYFDNWIEKQVNFCPFCGLKSE